MGMGAVICMFGFSVRYSNDFSEKLEGRSHRMDRHYREASLASMLGFTQLHGAVDAALAGDAERTATELDLGLATLARCNDHLTGIGEELVRARVELFEQETRDPADPLIAREPYFPFVDYEKTYRELLGRGAALPQRVFWDDVAARVRDGGARGGLRLLDRHLRELQSDLRTFMGECELARRLPLRDLAAQLHGTSMQIATLGMGFTRFLTAATYFSILCERASELLERQAAESDVAASVAS